MANKKSAKRGTTLEQLARLSQREFQAIHGKIGGLESKIGYVESGMKDGFVKIDSHFESMAQVLKLMRDDTKALHQQTSENEVDIIDLRTRLARVEKKVGLV